MILKELNFVITNELKEDSLTREIGPELLLLLFQTKRNHQFPVTLLSDIVLILSSNFFDKVFQAFSSICSSLFEWN